MESARFRKYLSFTGLLLVTQFQILVSSANHHDNGFKGFADEPEFDFIIGKQAKASNICV